MDNRPIGIFDSGLGGLTVVRELSRILPHEDIIYFGDTGRVPYGTRSRETIVRYARQDTSFLQTKNVKMIIAACGTVSSVAGDLGETLDVPFSGVLRPTAAAAAAASRNRCIGVIGTTATIRSGSYRRALAGINPEIRVFERDCPLFVPLVENGFIADDEEITRLVAERYLAPLKEAGIDTLILGCTHFPIIRNIISRVMGGSVRLIDSGFETALFCAGILKQRRLITDRKRKGNDLFFVSDRADNFTQTAELFLGRSVGSCVSRIDINTYEKSRRTDESVLPAAGSNQ